ncbi:MAG TPA: type II toxin-antitoxin system Phd/YefM family antitoxin, partial [Clostridiaceae bacterium]|nr:type II toxin-antitoxin system Phd/YefM family antitoxin [Clostridiaceae bacterium]
MLATATEMRNNFSHYLTQVTDENKEVIITKNNVRVARLVPYVS